MVPPMLKKPDVSPPKMSRKRSSSLDSVDEAFFLRPYVPLSNLPTPPLCSSSSSRQATPEPAFPGVALDPALFGPATHLKNLVPVDTSPIPASVSLIQCMLARAALPRETVALAVCVLEALNWRFIRAFRSLPRPRELGPIQPEVVVLAALILAVKFLDDDQERGYVWKEHWGNDMWTYEEINFGQQTIMENIEYRIMRLWAEDLIADALRCMELAGKPFEPVVHIHGGEGEDNIREGLEDCPLDDNGPMSAELAVKGLENQLTPAETPTKECPIRNAGSEVGDLFAEPFPAYVDAGLGIERLGLGY